MKERRSEILYNRKVASVSTKSAYLYHETLLPGNSFFQLLVPQGNKTGLQLCIPDIVVYHKFLSEDGIVEVDPVWYYTNNRGVVEKAIKFSEQALLAKLGNRNRPRVPVAFVKQACSVSQGSAMVYQGNTLKLINTAELAMHHEACDNHANITPSCTTAVQRFVLCNGSNASVTRCIWERDRKTIAQIITNTKPMFKVNSETAKVSKSRSINQKFCTQLHSMQGCTVNKISGPSVKEVDAAIRRIVTFVQRVHHLSLKKLIADFIFDQDRTLWLLEVKAFQVQGSTPDRLLLAAAEPRREPGVVGKIFLTSVNEVENNDSTGNKESPRNTEIRSKHSKPKENKLSGQLTRKCGCCGRSLQMKDMPYSLTRQFIDRVKRHIVRREAKTLTMPWMLPGWGRGRSLSSIHMETKEYSNGSGLAGRAAASDHGGNSALLSRNHKMDNEYRRWPVCELCKKLHDAEMKLMSLHANHSAVVGLINLKGDESNEMLTGVAPPRADLAVQNVAVAPENDDEWVTVNVLDMPAKLTLCRFFLAFHSLRHPPRPLLSLAKSLRKMRSCGKDIPRWLLPRLECTFLGTTTSVIIDVLRNDMDELETKDSDEEGKHRDIIVKRMQIREFLCENTSCHNHEELKQGGALYQLIKKKRSVEVEIWLPSISNTDVNTIQKAEDVVWEQNGTFEFSLSVFTNPHLTHQHQFSQIQMRGIHAKQNRETPLLEATIGLERLIEIPKSYFTNSRRIYQLQSIDKQLGQSGIYLPNIRMSACYCLPEKWMEATEKN
eukprot:g2909.t1